MEQELFCMEGISKSLLRVKALDQVFLTINKGEVLGLVGENSARKSALMKVLSGVYRADEEDICTEDQKMAIDSVAEAHGLGVSIIVQELDVYGHLSVVDNIFIGRIHKEGLFIDDKRMHEEAQEILDDLGIDLNIYAYAGSLGIARQQMVGITKAISSHSKILVLDEPMAILAEREIEQLFGIICRLKEGGVGMVYISHQTAKLNQICKQVTVIRDGQCTGTRNPADIIMDELVNIIVGRSLKDKYPKYVRTLGEMALKARNVRRGNGVNASRFYAGKGEILGISGLMGTGRTELTRCIFGANRADHMKLSLEGKPVKVSSVIQAVKHGIGYAIRDRKRNGLALGLDVKYNINMAHLLSITHFGFIDDKAGTVNAEEYVDLLRTKTPSIH